ncbi:MAG: flagellar hook-basal body complex protein FliE [Porticoccaceae bacterium]|jgi:flagellar hook-basal body complex protein FliE
MVNPTNPSNIESVLNQIRQYQARASAGVNLQSVAPAVTEMDRQTHSTASVGFTDSVKTAIREVNQTQQTAKAMRTAFERGEDMPLTEVVLGMQKSSLAFEATLQIRNKVLKAYQDIMNMPV